MYLSREFDNSGREPLALASDGHQPVNTACLQKRPEKCVCHALERKVKKNFIHFFHWGRMIPFLYFNNYNPFLLIFAKIILASKQHR
jgi:hypothetical protein